MHRFGIALLFLLSLQPPRAHAAIASVRDKWPQGTTISVCFMGAESKARKEIAEIAAEWTIGLSVSLDFGPAPEYYVCEGSRKYDVRVGFQARGFWAFLGRQSRSVPPDQPTVNLEGLEREVSQDGRTQVLQEFGHVLGLLHQEQDPQFVCRSDLNVEYLSRGASREALATALGPPAGRITRVSDTDPQPSAGNDGSYVATHFDKMSVMRLLIFPEAFRSGKSSPCYFPPVSEISEGDRQIVHLLYPPKPPRIVASTEGSPSQVSVVLSGELAPEHFGYLLRALYDIGKVSLKKHVSVDLETVGQVILDQDLAPKGRVAESFETFLCQVNPHICRTIKGRPVWSNTKANSNYVDDGKDCGDALLPKFVMCIPNIRLDSFPWFAFVKYEGQIESLARDVVDRLGGCANWNEACRNVIRKLNVQHKDTFLPESPRGSFLPANFKAELKVPALKYSLVLTYSGDEDRSRIERAVEDVANDRARSLGVRREEIAIELAYPARRSRAQAARMTSQPAAGYLAPLRVMNYPYLTEASEAELFGLRPGLVGIWDSRVDATHCELTSSARIVFPSYIDGQARSAPPQKAPSCGLLRASGYEMDTAYDHGTAVAGVLSALANGKGMAGVFPGLRIWALELPETNPIQGDPIQERMFPAFPDLDQPPIINISQTWDIVVSGRRTPEDLLLFGTSERPGLHKSTLFVTASGLVKTDAGPEIAQQIDTSTDCLFFPACWSAADGRSRGLISVVALNGAGTGILTDGQGKRLSNFGLVFDVAAVGEVTTLYYGDWVGVAQGSSFAAPYVTGLAALIRARAAKLHLSLSVEDLKQRILYTTDEPASIRGLSMYGRINFGKALAFTEDRVRLKPSPACATDPCWRTVKVKRNLNEKIRVVTGTLIDNAGGPGDPASNKEIPLTNIRSIRTEEDNTSTIFYSEGGRGLKQIRGAQLLSGQLPVLEVDGNSIPFDPSQILEYVSCAYLDACQ